MEIVVKLLNGKRYKDADTFEVAIERWVEKGWQLADIAQDIAGHGDDAIAILWKAIEGEVIKESE